MSNERILGTEITKEEFKEEYENQLEEKGNVEVINLKTDEVIELSENEFEEFIKENDDSE